MRRSVAQLKTRTRTRTRTGSKPPYYQSTDEGNATQGHRDRGELFFVASVANPVYFLLSLLKKSDNRKQFFIEETIRDCCLKNECHFFVDSDDLVLRSPSVETSGCPLHLKYRNRRNGRSRSRKVCSKRSAFSHALHIAG